MKQLNDDIQFNLNTYLYIDGAGMFLNLIFNDEE